LRLECTSIEVTLKEPARAYWAATLDLVPDMGTADEVFAMIQASVADRWKAEHAEPKPLGNVRAATSALGGGEGRLHVRLLRTGSKVRVVAAAVAGGG